MGISNFRAVAHYGQPSLTNQLETNLKNYLDWSLLQIGAWSNIYIGTSGPFGGDYSILHEVSDPNYTNGTVFQSIRKDFVWETGIAYVSPTGGSFDSLPIQVYVDNVIASTGDYYVNYPLGRVVFTTPPGGTITAQYSCREVQTYLADEINWWFEVQYNSWEVADTQWSDNISTGGDYSLAGSNRMQLPAIVIEMAGRTTAKPFELGTLSKFNKQDVLFHVIAQDRWDRNNISDYLRLQEEKTIVLYDIAAIYNAGLFPLDERGMVVSNPVMYPNIVNNSSLVYNTARFDKISITTVNTQHANLHWNVLRAQVEIIA